jgi:hypothetical protein
MTLDQDLMFAISLLLKISKALGQDKFSQTTTIQQPTLNA